MTNFCDKCGRTFRHGIVHNLYPVYFDTTGGMPHIYICDCCLEEEKRGEK
jgi:hypothetical protein